MKQYQQLLTDILNKGTKKLPARENLPFTISLFGTRIEHDISDGFPLLTTKKMAWKSIVHELLWFLRGETNIKYLVDNNVHIWDQDAYRWYLKTWNEYSDCFYHEQGDRNEVYNFQDFIDKIKANDIDDTSIPSDYELGDLGNVVQVAA